MRPTLWKHGICPKDNFIFFDPIKWKRVRLTQKHQLREKSLDAPTVTTVAKVLPPFFEKSVKQHPFFGRKRRVFTERVTYFIILSSEISFKLPFVLLEKAYFDLNPFTFDPNPSSFDPYLSFFWLGCWSFSFAAF